MVSGGNALGRYRPGLRRDHSAPVGPGCGRSRQRRHPLQAPIRQVDRRARRQRRQVVSAGDREPNRRSIRRCSTDCKDAMADVVNGAGGTAHKAHLDDIVVCGKTGTAQVVGGTGPSARGDRGQDARAIQGPRLVHRVCAEGSSEDRRRLHHRARRPWRQRGSARDSRRLAALLPAQSAAAETRDSARARRRLASR